MKKWNFLVLLIVCFIVTSCEKESQPDSSSIIENVNNKSQTNDVPDLTHLYEVAVQQVYKIADHQLTPDSILAISNRLFDDSESGGEPYNAIRAGILSSWYYFEKFKIDTARMLVNKNISFFKDNPRYFENLDHGLSTYNLAKICFRAKEQRLAKSYAQEAFRIFERNKQPLHMTNALSLSGSINFMISNYPQALENYLASNKIKDELGVATLNREIDIYNISLVLNRMGDYEKQLEYAHEALRLSEENGNFNNEMLVLNSLGNVYSDKLGKLDTGLYFYRRCQEVASANNNINRYYLAEINILHMYSGSENYRLSNNFAKQIINGGDEVPIWAKEEASALMAENYLKMGNPDSSISLGTIAYQLSLGYGSKEEIVNRADVLWKAYHLKEKYDSAFHYLNIQHVFKDSLYNAETQQKVSSLYAELETLEKQKEIEKLQSEKMIQEAKSLNLVIALTSGGIITILLFLSGVLAYRNREKKHKILKFELEREIELKKKDLNQQSLKIIQKDRNLSEIEEGLKKMKTKMVNGNSLEIQQILNTIRLSKSLEKEWVKFDEYFGNANHSFYDKMNTQFPDLSVSEKRLASLIKMKLSNREVASIMNIEDKSVRMAKYRLKKKLGLSDDQSVETFLANL